MDMVSRLQNSKTFKSQRALMRVMASPTTFAKLTLVDRHLTAKLKQRAKFQVLKQVL